ncbi:MAG: PilZ domain-containing protein [Planctomycetes bacterium]|nr:PilZ domain-containing protein [Planctomycetota bacterium]
MPVPQAVEQLRLVQVLSDSAAQQRPLVLTHHGPDGWRTIKSVFSGGSPESRTLRVSGMIEKELPAKALPGVGMTLGGSFRLGHKKFMFCAMVQGVERHSDRLELMLRWPDHLQQLQRRVYERAEPPVGSVVAVRFWRDEASSATERKVRHGQLEDISAGGMRIKVSETGDIAMESTYRCSFTPRPGRPAIVLDAILRHRQAVDSGRASLGFQFVGLETTPEGMKTLDRLARVVTQFQRLRVRKMPAT